MTKPLPRAGSSDAPDEELARRAAQGEASAFEALMRRHNRAMFRTARAIPIAPARENAALLEKAFDRIDAELAGGEVVCIFPEGKLTRDGEMNEFKKGVERILERRPVPVVPMALRGLWGSFFSRRDGKSAMSQLPSRFWSRIELIATAPVHGQTATASDLHRIVLGLRGEWQ